MANLDLSKYGIQDVKEIIHNPSYDVLFAEETKPGLEGFEKGQVTELGAVNVMTGIYTGRSPKDKFFVMNEASKDSVWWTSEEYKNDNKPCSEEAWADLKAKAVKELSGKRLFVVDTFCGANPATRMKVRFIMEVAWQAHFVTNMFIRPTAEELANYGEPDFVSFNASKAKVDNYKELGLNSETATVFNLKTNEQVILNTWYGGEMKKGMFSIMNYKNPLRGIASMPVSYTHLDVYKRQLRELTIGYQFPEKMISKLGLGRLSVSVFGRNLFYFYKALKNYDAESSVGTSWANQPARRACSPRAARRCTR